MPDEFTPEEQDILANSPADAPVIVGDGDADDQPADEDVMGTAGGPSTVPDGTEADPEPDDPS
jgi:hypothetical protein